MNIRINYYFAKKLNFFMSLKIRKTSISINKRSNLTFDSMMEMLQVYPLLSRGVNEPSQALM